MTKDYICGAVGDVGPWQVTVSVLMSLLKLPIGWFQLSIMILEADVDYWCVSPEPSFNLTAAQWRNYSEASGDRHREQSCMVSTSNSGPSVKCESWEFSEDVFTSNIVTEWRLVCDRKSLVDVTQATFMLGVLLGNIIFGTLADRYGRKTPLLVAIVAQSASGIGSSLVPWFWVFVLLRFILALSVGGLLVISFVLVMEVMGAKWRPTTAILYQIPFSLGSCFMAAVSFGLRDWRDFHLALSLISVLYLPYYWFVPESPRWLLTVGRDREAIRILQKAARWNHRDPLLVEKAVENHKKQQRLTERAVNHAPTAVDLLRTPRLRRNTLILYFNWFVASLTLFAFMQSINQIGGNLFANIVLAGCVAVPGTLFCIFVMRFGRRRPMMVTMATSGVAALLIAFFPRDVYHMDWPRVVLSGVVMMSMSMSFPALYLFSGEIFPTAARNVGIGSASMIGRFGAIVAPFVKSLHMYGDWVTPVVIGVASILGSISVYFLPETQNCQLPDTLHDGEHCGDKPEEQNSNYILIPQKADEKIASDVS